MFCWRFVGQYFGRKIFVGILYVLLQGVEVRGGVNDNIPWDLQRTRVRFYMIQYEDIGSLWYQSGVSLYQRNLFNAS
jgi:hypothetical protein